MHPSRRRSEARDRSSRRWPVTRPAVSGSAGIVMRIGSTPADAAPDPSRFAAEVLPRLQGVVLRDIASVAGLSLTRAAQIRNGAVIPHPRQWPALAGLPDGSPPANPSGRGSGRRGPTLFRP